MSNDVKRISAKVHRAGMSLMIAGILLIVSAIGLVGYNVWESNKAGEASEQALVNLDAIIFERQMEKQNGGGDETP